MMTMTMTTRNPTTTSHRGSASVLGYCKKCDRLVAISPGVGITARARETGTSDKYPVQHAAPARHIGCMVDAQFEAPVVVVEGVVACTKCERELAPAEVRPGDPDCAGRKVPA